MRHYLIYFYVSFLLTISIVDVGLGEDWPRFRGPNGSGHSTGKGVPTQWTESRNMRWKLALPGPGSSSPIVVNGKVFITCYSGYGAGNGGKQADLKRHLLCVDAKKGNIIWKQTIKAILPEDDYRGFITHHGYASHTPVSDGTTVIAFFGKSGVFAFDMNGRRLWQKSVGSGSGASGWGTASSPILYKNLVIINAAAESETIYALDKKTGMIVWQAEATQLKGCWSTPILADTSDGTKELVLSVPNEVWALNPDTGKLKWYAKVPLGSFVCPSVISIRGIVYASGGRGRGDGAVAAIKTGGEADVTKTHVLWVSQQNSPVPTPIFYKNHIYCLSDSGLVFCIDSANGNEVFSKRLLRGGGGGNRSTYASMVANSGRIFAVSRSEGTFVIEPGSTYRQIAVNRIENDRSAFHGTPAISSGMLYLRSDSHLYCIGEQ